MIHLSRTLRRLCNFSSDSDIETLYELPSKLLTQNVIGPDKRFLDYTKIKVEAGSGGNGCVTFVRNRGSRGAYPSGGDGGSGGSVYVQVSKALRSLPPTKEVVAGNGAHGTSRDMDGKGGADKIIHVPIGTVLKEIAPIGQYTNIHHLDSENDKVKVAHGGRGGRGNKKHYSIKKTETGQIGDRKEIELEMKLIADVGLVGFPNAGKSSLVGSMTRACPKVASYPFTTLRPYIGVIEFEDKNTITVADMPGLIEGSHLNKGLGHEFLRHIQRTKLLLYVLDVSKNPLKDLHCLYQELKLYDESLSAKPFILALNKIDLADGAEYGRILQETFGKEPIFVSAKEGINIGELVISIRNSIESIFGFNKFVVTN